MAFLQYSRSFNTLRVLTPSILSVSPLSVTIGNRMASNSPSPVVINPTGKHEYTLIFMHGLGDQGYGWSEQFPSRHFPNWKLIFPHAPSQKVTLNLGLEMPSWFDILTLSETGQEDEIGIRKASDEVGNWIERESAIIPSENIALGGFSQGGALALYTGLRYSKKLLAVIALSSWLPLRNDFPAAMSENNKNIPIFHGHGDSDFIVPARWGQMSKTLLESLGHSKYDLKMYKNMEHSSCPEEIEDIKQFIAKICAKK